MCFRASQTSLLFDLQRQRLSHEQACQMLCSSRITKHSKNTVVLAIWCRFYLPWMMLLHCYCLGRCLGLPSPCRRIFPGMEQYGAWQNFVLAKGWLEACSSYTSFEWRGTQGRLCKVRCQKTGPLSKNSRNDLFFIIIRIKTSDCL